MVKDLRIGDRVQSFPGNRISEIECVVVSNIFSEIQMVRLPNDCFITFEHPILVRSDGTNIVEEKMNEFRDLNALHSDAISKYGLQWVLPKNAFDAQHRY